MHSLMDKAKIIDYVSLKKKTSDSVWLVSFFHFKWYQKVGLNRYDFVKFRPYKKESTESEISPILQTRAVK